MNKKHLAGVVAIALLIAIGTWVLGATASANESVDAEFVTSLLLAEVDANNIGTVVNGEVMLNESAFFVTDEDDFSMELAEEPVVIAKPIEKAYDAFTTTNYSADDFNAFLELTTLKGMGDAFVKLEEEHRINGVFALSILCNESGYGQFKANTNNYFGMKNSKGYMRFESFEANLMYFGRLMHENWYAGKSLEQIAKTYCPPTYQSWLSTVTYLMGQFYDMR